MAANLDLEALVRELLTRHLALVTVLARNGVVDLDELNRELMRSASAAEQKIAEAKQMAEDDAADRAAQLARMTLVVHPEPSSVIDSLQLGFTPDRRMRMRADLFEEMEVDGGVFRRKVTREWVLTRKDTDKLLKMMAALFAVDSALDV